MAEAKWTGVLSTTEPRNDIGILNVRQGNLNAEIVEFQIVQNNKPYDLTGAKVYFCTNFGLSAVEKEAVIKDAVKGIITFIFNNESMQIVGRHMGYFEIMKDDVKIDSTQDFEFRVQDSILTRKMEGGSYIESFEKILETLGDNAAYGLAKEIDKANERVDQVNEIVKENNKGYGGTYDTLAKLKEAIPNGNDKRYGVKENGNWYYWSGEWKSGGILEEAVIGERTVSPGHTDFLKPSEHEGSNLFSNYINNYAVITEGSSLAVYKETEFTQHRTAIIPIEPFQKYRISGYQHNRYRIGVLNSNSYTIPDKPTILKLDRILLNETNPTLNTLTFTNDANGKYLFVYLYSGTPITEPVLEVIPYQNYFKKNMVSVAPSDIEGIATTNLNLFENQWMSNFGFDSSGTIHKDNELFRTAYIRIKKGEKYSAKIFGNHTSFNLATTINIYNENMNLSVLLADPSKSIFSFTSAIDGWLLIFLGPVGENKPYVQIIEGISDPGLPELHFHNQRLLTESDKEEILSDLETSFQPAHYLPEVDGANLSLSYANFIAQFTAYKAKYPDYITSRTIMNDTSNTYPIYEFAFTPKVVKQTIFLTAGIHGDEPESYWSLYNLVKKLCDEEYSHPIIRYLRNYVKIVMIPVVNPWGYVNKTRENSRGINCNRNFDVFYIPNEPNHSEGAAPFSENETKAVKDVLEKYEGQFTFHLDLHTVPTKWGEVGLHAAYAFVSPDSELSDTLTATQEYIIRFWNNKYGIDVATSYKDTTTSDMKNYVQNVKNVPSATLEYVSCNFSPQLADELESIRSFEWYVNVIGDVSELFKQ